MSLLANPEFVRYARAELRPARALAAGLVTLVVCYLAGLWSWGVEHDSLRDFLRTFYGSLVGIQFGTLALWSASACGQAISRERELKNYDFLRTTRLTPFELALGKLFGAPIMGWFVVGCSLPVSLFAGLTGGFSAAVILQTYLLMTAFAIFGGAGGLWFSLLAEKTSGAAIALLVVLPPAITWSFLHSPYPGLSALSVAPGLMALYVTNADQTAPLFGVELPYVALSLLLWAAFGAWLVLMLVRNMKKDMQEIRLLSRWQAVGFAAFLNLLLYAFQQIPQPKAANADSVTLTVVILNAVVLFLIGLFLLTPSERLKVWKRNHAAGAASYLSEDGLPWPWLVLAAAAAYALLLAGTLVLHSDVPVSGWRLEKAALQLLILLLYVTRDVLFLQWCMLTRMKRPVVKGILLLALYYLAAGVMAGMANIISEAGTDFVRGLTTPAGVFFELNRWVYVGMAIQVAIIILILSAISRRLSRPAITLAPAASG